MYFNPHSHTGSDIHIFRIIPIVVISIHTPTQGVTVNDIMRKIIKYISIHTPTQGVTRAYLPIYHA